MTVCVLIAIIKKCVKLAPSLYSLRHTLSRTQFEKTTWQEVLQGATPPEND